MPAHGTWAITQKGIARIERIAMDWLKWEEPGTVGRAVLHSIPWDRFSDEFLKRLKALGAELKQRKEEKGEQRGAPNGGSASGPPASVN
jgi:hypothetical protein